VTAVEWLSVSEAVARYIEDGQVLYLAGFTHLIPFAFGHEIIRQHKRGLTLCRATPDLLYEQMLAGQVADKVVFSYAGNPGVGLLPVFRRAVETGAVAIEEWTHFEMVARLAAGAAGVPFWPVNTLDNDLSRRRARPRVASPFTGELVPVVPPLAPDVTLLHAHAADEEGNIYVDGLLGEMREAALAARRVLVSVETCEPARDLRAGRLTLLLPAFRVASVSVEPWGAHPSYVLGRYDRDTLFYREWDAQARQEVAVDAWLQEFVYGVADRAEYVRQLPAGRLRTLKEAALI
jgi:glutaconate CoA-transferase subunit A